MDHLFTGRAGALADDQRIFADRLSSGVEERALTVVVSVPGLQISVLKAKIEESQGFPVAHQKLIHSGGSQKGCIAQARW